MADASDAQQVTLYDAIGREATVRKLVMRFYELMDTLPEAKACRAIHPPSLVGSEQKLYEYFTGWMGGPQLFVEKYGHPMLRRRHFGAPIGPEEISGWIACFEGAIAGAIADERYRANIIQQVRQLALHMQNRK